MEREAKLCTPSENNLYHQGVSSEESSLQKISKFCKVGQGGAENTVLPSGDWGQHPQLTPKSLDAQIPFTQKCNTDIEPTHILQYTSITCT